MVPVQTHRQPLWTDPDAIMRSCRRLQRGKKQGDRQRLDVILDEAKAPLQQDEGKRGQ